MSLGAIFGSVLSLDRQRARYESEQVDAQEQGELESRSVASAERETATASSSSNNDLGSVVQPGGEVAAPPSSSRTNSRSRRIRSNLRNSRRSSRSETRIEEEENIDESLAEEAFSAEGSAPAGRVFVTATTRTRENTITLAELEEQRELSRRRSSACVLFAIFVLFRLWVECLQTQDPTLLLLCLLGTSWTARWIRFNREREEELDRRIEHYLQNNNNTNEVDRNEYARLSFQAQLALAIMESQRYMMEGGYGRPDGLEDQAPGVSEEAKAKWKHFHWMQGSGKGEYGALPKGDDHEIDNHCSICLGEYEDAEPLTQLPCGHVYHLECINSWTTNHTRCPLCNVDLQSISGENEV